MKNKFTRLLLLAVPCIVLAVLVCAFAVNVPYMDQWELVSVFEKHQAGTLGFADFFAQHNEHRLLFPRLAMYGLALLSGWDVRVEMLASVALAGITFVLLYSLLRRTIADDRVRLLTGLAIGIVFFSPMQWENWLWGWQIQWYLNVLGLVVALWALTVWRANAIWRVVAAAAGALLATYSLGSGFFVWLLCIPVLWFTPQLRRWIGPWLAASVLAVISHYVGYQDPMYSPSRELFLHEPVAFVKYIVIYLAHPLAPIVQLTGPVAIAYGGGLLAALGYVWYRWRGLLTTSLLPWLVLGVYACMASASTAVARLGLGTIQGYSSRYLTLSVLLLMLFMVLLAVIWEKSERKKQRGLNVRMVVLVAAAVVGVLSAANYGKGVLQMHQNNVYMRKVQQCARHAGKDSPCLVMLYPSPGAVYPRLEFLRQHHWADLQ